MLGVFNLTEVPFNRTYRLVINANGLQGTSVDDICLFHTGLTYANHEKIILINELELILVKTTMVVQSV